MKFYRLFLFAVMTLSSAFVPQAAHATNQIIIDYNTVPTGLPSPDGSGPWLRAILTDLTDTDNDGDVDGVQIDFIGKFASPNFVSEIAFNLINDDQSYLDTINANCLASAGTTTCNSNDVFKATSDSQTLNNFKGFDMTFFLPPPQGGDSNTLGSPPDAIRYILTALNLDVTDFVQLSETTDTSTFFTMAKIQGLSNEGSTSITINTRPTPRTFNGTEVPAPLPLAGAFFAFGISRKLRSRIRSTSTPF